MKHFDPCGRIILAACPLTSTIQSIRDLHDHHNIHTMVAKTVTADPIKIIPKYDNGTNIHKAADGAVINSIGLANPGCSSHAADMSTVPSDGSLSIIQSVAAASIDDLQRTIAALDGLDCIVAYEINMSCPNHCRMLADPSLISRATNMTKKPVWAKVSYKQAADGQAAKYLQAGASHLTVINTLPAVFVDDAGIIQTGGVSGTPLRHLALWAVQSLAVQYPARIIGCGGISTQQDISNMQAAGACAVQVGTAAMADPGVFSRLEWS